MIGLNGWAVSPNIAWQIQTSELVLMGVAAAIAFAPLWRPRLVPNLPAFPAWASSTGYVLLAVAALSRMASQTYSPFLYFQF